MARIATKPIGTCVRCRRFPSYRRVDGQMLCKACGQRQKATTTEGDAMTTKTTPEGLRTCKGSARFGIEPHDAAIADFPTQPSRKDGLGAMCTEHWKAYVKGLREARKAAKTA